MEILRSSLIFLDVFLSKVPAHPKGMLKKVFLNFSFEFLIMFDLFRENACSNSYVYLLQKQF